MMTTNRVGLVGRANLSAAGAAPRTRCLCRRPRLRARSTFRATLSEPQLDVPKAGRVNLTTASRARMQLAGCGWGTLPALQLNSPAPRPRAAKTARDRAFQAQRAFTKQPSSCLMNLLCRRGRDVDLSAPAVRRAHTDARNAWPPVRAREHSAGAQAHSRRSPLRCEALALIANVCAFELRCETFGGGASSGLPARSAPAPSQPFTDLAHSATQSRRVVKCSLNESARDCFPSWCGAPRPRRRGRRGREARRSGRAPHCGSPGPHTHAILLPGFSSGLLGRLAAC